MWLKCAANCSYSHFLKGTHSSQTSGLTCVQYRALPQWLRVKTQIHPPWRQVYPKGETGRVWEWALYDELVLLSWLAKFFLLTWAPAGEREGRVRGWKEVESVTWMEAWGIDSDPSNAIIIVHSSARVVGSNSNIYVRSDDRFLSPQLPF